MWFRQLGPELTKSDSLGSFGFGFWPKQYTVYGAKYIYKEYHSVCPLVGIGTLPTPLSPASVPLPPELKGEGGTLTCGWGVGGVPIPTTGEKLSTLPTLWFMVKPSGKVYPSFPSPRLPGSSLHMAGRRCLRCDAALRSAHCHVTVAGMWQNSQSSSLDVGARTVPHS